MGIGLFLVGCEVGKGEGDIQGSVVVRDCGLSGAYDLAPTYYAAEDSEERLDIIIQHGSDLQIQSDGVFLMVTDTSDIRLHRLGAPLPIAYGYEAPVQLVLYLNESCDIGRGTNPVSLNAVSGTVVFDAIYAPLVNDNESIDAQLHDVKLEDPKKPTERYGSLDGYFRFTFSRGRPAQRFP
ncbi:MAG: hypothetical protein H6715_04140 [Myxococcales bacterium]|nr:hypothetical protein [Myxococcales bacterium]MCB9708606.1 hypothetical protein [Myxococcales bacterium]